MSHPGAVADVQSTAAAMDFENLIALMKQEASALGSAEVLSSAEFSDAGSLADTEPVGSETEAEQAEDDPYYEEGGAWQ